MSQTQESETTVTTRLLTPASAAKALNVSLSAVYNLIRCGDLLAVNLAPSNASGKHGFWRISQEALDEFLRQRLTAAKVPAASQRASTHRRLNIPIYLGL